MGAHVVSDVRFEPDYEEIGKQILLEAYPELEHEVQDLLAQSVAVARPKAIYRIVPVGDRDGAWIRIGEQRFESEDLRENLKDIDDVVAYVATCGAELDAIDLSSYDPLSEYWISVIKEHALRAVTATLYETVERRHGRTGLSQMNPGSANVDVWPLSQQAGLFALFNGGAVEIGVRLTESYLMIPDKSVSGVLFESASGYVNCHACDRENCPDRRAPFLETHTGRRGG